MSKSDASNQISPKEETPPEYFIKSRQMLLAEEGLHRRGGFVAGIDAGFSYNTFPLMDGSFFPPDLYQLSPFYLNLFEDVMSVQFNHRVLAQALFVIVTIFWLKALKLELGLRGRLAVNFLAAVVLVQVVLGITTLLLLVPLTLAAFHQAGAVIVFMAALWVAREVNNV